MQNAILLQQEVDQLHAVAKYKKKKQDAPQYYIAAGRSLTGAEGQQRSQECAVQDHWVQEEQQSSRPRRRMRCSNCGQEGHNASDARINNAFCIYS